MYCQRFVLTLTGDI